METTTVARMKWFAKHMALAYVGAVVGAMAVIGLGLTGYRFSASLLVAFWMPCAVVLACAAIVTARYARWRGLGVGAFLGTTVWMCSFLVATVRA